MNTINSHVILANNNAVDNQHHQQRSSKHLHQQHQQQQQQQHQDISMSAEIVDREYMTFNNSKLIEDLASIQLAPSTPVQHYNHQQQQQQPQQNANYPTTHLHHHPHHMNDPATINKNSFESVESIEKNIVYSSHQHPNTTSHYNVAGKNHLYQESSTPISIPITSQPQQQQQQQQPQKRNSLSKTQLIIDPATKLLHLPPIPYIKQQQQQIKSSSNQLHQIHSYHHHQPQQHLSSNNNSSSIVNINTSGLSNSVNNNDVLKLNPADYSNKSLTNYMIHQQQQLNREQQTDMSFSAEKKQLQSQQHKANLISYAVQNDMYYKTIATQTNNIGFDII